LSTNVKFCIYVPVLLDNGKSSFTTLKFVFGSFRFLIVEKDPNQNQLFGSRSCKKVQIVSDLDPQHSFVVAFLFEFSSYLVRIRALTDPQFGRDELL